MTFQNAGDIATKLVDRWAWWQSALKDPAEIGKSLPVHESDPQQGYFRVRPKDGQWEPVAIFYPEESDQLVAYRNGREVSDVNSLWTWCCRNPISFDAYEKAMAGDGFDDEPVKARGIGDNSGEADPYDALKIEYLGEKEMAEEFMKSPVKTQAGADKVAIWADRLRKIKSKAEAFHKVEKQPHLDAGRAVDDKWRDLKTEPAEIIEKLRLHTKPFFDEQKRKEEERQRQAREEADRIRREAEEAERARIAAEKEQAKKVADGMTDAAAIAEHNAKQEALRQAAEEAAAKARQAEKDAEARKVNAGRTGARMGLRKQTVGVVTDYGKAAAALVAMKHPDIIEIIDKLANRAAKAGMPFDGMEIKEEEIVR